MRSLKKNFAVVAGSAVLVATLASVSSAAITSSDLVAYWKLDGDLTDSAGTNHGSFVDAGANSVTFGTGFDGTPGGAANFQGTADYITTPLVVPTGAKTISLFFTTTNTDFQALAGVRGSGQRFYLNVNTVNPGTIQLGAGNGGQGAYLPTTALSPPSVANVTPSAGYAHLVGVDDGAGNTTVYYRGPGDTQFGMVVQNPYTGTSGGTDGFAIGHLLDAGFVDQGLQASGLIDDVAVFNRMLTLSEIETIYSAGSVGAALVPEAGAATLLMLGAAGFVRVARRRRK